MKTIGIMGAMTEEIALLREQMDGAEFVTHGMREYVSGRIRGQAVTVVFSRWGKVASASTATTLIEHFQAGALFFTGVAGAVDPVLNIGDIVVADALIQHDMDVSALAGIERFEIPLLGKSRFPAEPSWVQAASRAAQDYLSDDLRRDVDQEILNEFDIQSPRVVAGVVASGDQFIADQAAVERLRTEIPGLQCVEMEGAAVAQVAYEHQIPSVVVRTISDKADHSAALDFPRFVDRVASHFTCGCILRLLESLPKE